MKLRVAVSDHREIMEREEVVINGLEDAELAGRLASRKVKELLRSAPLGALRNRVELTVTITLAGEGTAASPPPPSRSPAKAPRRARRRAKE